MRELQEEDHDDDETMDADIIWEEERGVGRRLKAAPVDKIVQYITRRNLQGPSFFLLVVFG